MYKQKLASRGENILLVRLDIGGEYIDFESNEK